MKFNLATIFFFFSIIAISQNKTFEVTYVKGYKNFKDTTSTTPKILKNLKYKLTFNNIEGRFEYIDQMVIDGTKNNSRYKGKGGGNGIYYKNVSSEENLWQFDELDKTFLVEDNFKKYKWELFKGEKKIILGYLCYKAVGTYEEYTSMRGNKTIKVEVWYSPDIPVSFGPSGYDGVPGLVLESKKGSFYFIAEKIKEVKKNNTKIIKPKGERISRDGLNKMLIELVKSKRLKKKIKN